MKFEEGKFIVKSTQHIIHNQYLFLKVWKQNNQYWYRVDDQPKKKIDQDTKDYIINELSLHSKLPDNYKPTFSSIKLTIEATSDLGTHHSWTKKNGEVTEKLLKVFPDLINSFWTDKYRKQKIKKYLSLPHHKPNNRY
jgi:hypothetical protein